MNKKKLWLVLCLADLLVGAAAMAMPVTQPAGQDVLQREQELGASQPSHAQIQTLRMEAGVATATATATNSPALLDLAKQPGAEFEAVLVKGEVLHGSGPRSSQRAEQELFGSVGKEGLISAEVKSVLKDLRGELHQLTGDHFRNAQAAGEAEQERLARRLDEAKSARAESAQAAGGAVSEEERRLGAWQVWLMTEQLIEEIKPWVITAAVLFVLFHAAQAVMRKQAAIKLARSKSIRQAGHGAAAPSAAPVPEQAAVLSSKGRRVRVKQRIRLTSSSASSSRSRRRQPL
ncbi:hypothetical protein LNV09_21275 [Paucibacter sp. B2R-40]|uniref:hypothetical protein n=1 Tax=Paucibacter sp. B2R-40 TaxID=2893554 RepID=UPI0021E36323|nr:hypothetical protein [Paucibacter sp. B2R-40]MCV2356680.1 hypothetical protein [Paucibacter sp. B2R-40]